MRRVTKHFVVIFNDIKFALNISEAYYAVNAALAFGIGNHNQTIVIKNFTELNIVCTEASFVCRQS